MNWEKLAAATLVEAGRSVQLAADFDPARKPAGLTKQQGLEQLERGKAELFDLQDRFYAQADRSLLIVLQAIDAAGKDGTIKHVMAGINPEGVDVYSFKAPSSAERAHDYLWRHQLVLPELGRIAVFNRSHYENVTVTRVHPELLWPAAADSRDRGLWRRRYTDINAWEKHLTDNGTVIVKLFLNVSRDEQARRFLARIDRPEKNWKFSRSDLTERERWDDYQRVFDAMLSHTSTEHAPWHVIPADHKWFSHLSTFSVLLKTLRELDPQYPAISSTDRAALKSARKKIKRELGD